MYFLKYNCNLCYALNIKLGIIIQNRFLRIFLIWEKVNRKKNNCPFLWETLTRILPSFFYDERGFERNIIKLIWLMSTIEKSNTTFTFILLRIHHESAKVSRFFWIALTLACLKYFRIELKVRWKWNKMNP